MTTLTEQIGAVMELRQQEARLREEKDELYKTWEVENQGLLGRLRVAEGFRGLAEATLRELTLSAYRETGNKRPAPGVAVRIVTKLVYQETQALDWATGHGLALKLDRVAFERLAKASPLPFVEIKEEPQATIATDLAGATE